MRLIIGIVALAFFTTAGFTQTIENNNITCEHFLKLNRPQVETGDDSVDKVSAKDDSKITAYCEANPKAKLMEAAENALK